MIGLRPALLFVFALAIQNAAPDRANTSVNPFLFGTWTLNVERSVYQLGPSPRTQTQIYEPSGDGLKVAVETITGDGGRITYGYTARLDGREYPMEGDLTPNGAETIAIRRIDSLTTQAILRRRGEVVLTIRSVLSPDGKLLTLTSKGTNTSELPTNSVTVFDKR
jgi:hypothetical protein